MSEPRLIVEMVAENGSSTAFLLGDGAELRFGRNPDTCRLLTEDPTVSREHLRFVGRGTHVEVQDLGSRYGSYLGDGRALSGVVELRSGDRVRAGRVTLRVRSPNEHLGELVALKRRVHGELLERLDLRRGGKAGTSDEALKREVRATLELIVAELGPTQLGQTDPGRLVKEVLDEAVGLGPLEDALADAEVSEIMVVDRDHIYVERRGQVSKLETSFTSDDAIRAVIERIVTPLGRRIDEAQPLVDARLKDGSRVNAIIPPLALKGPCITIRKFSGSRLDVQGLLEKGALSPAMAKFLELAVRCRKNIIVSGGTGSGKTTLLNILSSFIEASERVVTIEDAAELQLQQEHVVSLETRPPNLEGKGAFEIRDLVKNALRMRPDRIVVGECRGGEAIDMLQAMNTGHDGSLTTIHANSPSEAVTRLESLILMYSGGELPLASVRQQIAQAVDLVVQQTRFSDGTRKITFISEVDGIDDHGRIVVQDLFRFRHTAGSTPGKVAGVFRRSGRVPSFYGQLVVAGLVKEGEFL